MGRLEIGLGYFRDNVCFGLEILFRKETSLRFMWRHWKIERKLHECYGVCWSEGSFDVVVGRYCGKYCVVEIEFESWSCGYIVITVDFLEKAV